MTWRTVTETEDCDLQQRPVSYNRGLLLRGLWLTREGCDLNRGLWHTPEDCGLNRGLWLKHRTVTSIRGLRLKHRSVTSNRGLRLKQRTVTSIRGLWLVTEDYNILQRTVTKSSERTSCDIQITRDVCLHHLEKCDMQPRTVIFSKAVWLTTVRGLRHKAEDLDLQRTVTGNRGF